MAPKGMNLVVNTTVPLGSGLSSSSSFVVCSFLATSRAHGVMFDQQVVGTPEKALQLPTIMAYIIMALKV